MLNTLICTQCSEPVVTSSRNIVLAFVCDSCQSQKEATMCVNECTPAIDAAVNGNCEDVVAQAREAVDNTSKLIDDLTAQLEAERNTVMKLEADNSELAEQNETIARLSFRKSEQIAELLAENSELQAQLTRVTAISDMVGLSVKLAQAAIYGFGS